MEPIQNPWIKLKERINGEDYILINKLQEECAEQDQIALKLELEYKLKGETLETDRQSNINDINEFMYFDGQKLIGYIGICSFGGADSPIEVNGMVHPLYRKQGVFKILSKLVIDEWKRGNGSSMLLLCDRASKAGQSFIKTTGAQYKHSEYEMYLKGDNGESSEKRQEGIHFRKAVNADAYEIARQNAIYFSDEIQDDQDNSCDNKSEKVLKEREIPQEDIILPEEEEKRGVITYLAEKEEQMIGKVHLQLAAGVGGIYGLGVLPEQRRKGFGREILMMAVEKLKASGADEIKLQVAAENANALNLYKSCGFMETSTMDYYELSEPFRENINI